jgi:hypothetical protein
MKKVFFLLGLFLLGTTALVNAQTKSELQIGLSLPQGKFGGDNVNKLVFNNAGSKEGGASTGFHIGYKLLTPLSTEGLYWTLSANIIYNDLNSDIKDEVEEDWDDSNMDGDYTLPKYFNIPILAGLQYEKPIAENLSLYGETGIGLNVLKITNSSGNYEYSYYYYESKITFKPSFSLGYKFGAGIVINNKYTIGLTYLGLGSHKIKYESESNGGSYYTNTSSSDEGKLKKRLNISLLNLSFGLRF